MKKLYSLTAALFLAFAANAAVGVSYNGQTVANGQTLEFGKEMLKPQEGLPFAAYLFDEHVTVTGTAPITFSASSDNNTISYCLPNGSCFTLNDNGSGKFTSSTSLTASPTDVDFKTQLFVGSIPDVKSSVLVTVTDAAGSSMSFTVKLDSSIDGVASIEADKVTVKSQGKNIVFSAGTPTPLTIYSLAGNTILKRTVNGNGTISLAGVPTGIYLYRAGSHIGKIVIR